MKRGSDISAYPKERIRKWLEINGIPCRDDCLKVELCAILEKIAPSPTYLINEIVRKEGDEVLRTPPYHLELQPIEVCWGVIKNDIARNCNFTMKNLEKQLVAAFNKVTSKTCQKNIKKIRKTEDQFWEEDAKTEQK